MSQNNITPSKQSKSIDSWFNHFGNHSIYKWLFFLVILGLIIIIIGYNTSFYSKNNSPNQNSNSNSNSNINNKNRPKNNKVKDMEIEALVADSPIINDPSQILSNNPLLITDLESISKQANWDNNYDILIVPSGKVKSDLELDYTPIKNLSSLSKKPKLASIILNINQLNNLEYSQIISLANTITNTITDNDWTQYIGLNVNIDLDKATDKAQKSLTQLLAELKANLKLKNLKLTVQTQVSSFDISNSSSFSSSRLSTLFTQVDQVLIIVPNKKSSDNSSKIKLATEQQIKNTLKPNQIKYIFTN